jgi:hypothetical protein
MYECETCTAFFYDPYERDDHMDEYGHWPECEICPRTFRTQRACNQHMNNAGHWALRYECETCTKSFRSLNAAHQHMDSKGHWARRWPCETCKNTFYTEEAAEQHMQSLGHYRYYCKTCDRRFQNENNLQMVRLKPLHSLGLCLTTLIAPQFPDSSWPQRPVSLLQGHVHDRVWPRPPPRDRCMPAGSNSEP